MARRLSLTDVTTLSTPDSVSQVHAYHCFCCRIIPCDRRGLYPCCPPASWNQEIEAPRVENMVVDVDEVGDELQHKKDSQDSKTNPNQALNVNTTTHLSHPPPSVTRVGTPSHSQHPSNNHSAQQQQFRWRKKPMYKFNDWVLDWCCCAFTLGCYRVTANEKQFQERGWLCYCCTFEDYE